MSLQRLIRLAEVMERTGLKRNSIWRKVRAGSFPAPVKIAENAVAWHDAEITEWQESRPRVAYAPVAEAVA